MPPTASPRPMRRAGVVPSWRPRSRRNAYPSSRPTRSSRLTAGTLRELARATRGSSGPRKRWSALTMPPGARCRSSSDRGRGDHPELEAERVEERLEGAAGGARHAGVVDGAQVRGVGPPGGADRGQHLAARQLDDHAPPRCRPPPTRPGPPPRAPAVETCSCRSRSRVVRDDRACGARGPGGGGGELPLEAQDGVHGDDRPHLPGGDAAASGCEPAPAPTPRR